MPHHAHKEQPVTFPPSAAPLDTPDAAGYVNLSQAALLKMRQQGRGPAFVRLGRAVRYLPADLDAWLAKNRVQPGRAR